MQPPIRQGDLFDGAPGPRTTIHVSARCSIHVQDERWVVLGSGIPLLHFVEGDAMGRAHAIVSIVEQEWATQVEAARAFECTARTVRRFLERFAEGGLSSLGRRPGCPAGLRRRPSGQSRQILALKQKGLSNREIGGRLDISEKAVRKALRKLGWNPAPAPELPLDPGGSNQVATATAPPGAQAPGADPNLSAFPADPNLSSFEEEAPFTLDRDPSDRRMDRLMACLGLLSDAAPLFRPGQRVPRAGVLLAVPSILATGVLVCAREVYGSLGPAFYGLRTSIVAFLMMALLRIKRPEAIKEHSPADLGRLLGLDRAPEVKTLRRKLHKLAVSRRAAEFGRALARRRVATHGAAMGFLYIDGHVRVYHGRHEIPYAHVARMRIAQPATSDYWVNDAVGDPLFVVTAEANAGLAKMLPPLLGEIRALVGERGVTVVFDRGGWSPKLFQKVLKQGFDLLTYRKGASPTVPKKCFREVTERIEGRDVTYTLADQEIRLLKGGLRLRQVTRLSDNGHRTPIVTSRRDLTSVQVAFRMFERWRQENFFKYLREEFALDALVEHAVEDADGMREVPNPDWAALTREIAAARQEIQRASAIYGIDAFVNPEGARPTMRGFKIANAKQGEVLSKALEKLTKLESRRAKAPRRVPVKAVVDGAVVKLAPERQHLSSLLKMVAYQAESDLVRRIRPHYRRAEQEGRTLVATALASAADIDVTESELRVTLAPLSSPHRSKAVAALCAELDSLSARFPGTRLRMRFSVASPPQKRTNG